MRFLLFILIFFLNNPCIRAQDDTIVINRLIVYNNKTIDNINTVNVKMDLIEDRNKMIYLKLQPKQLKNVTLEYFRINDTTYHYRKQVNKRIVEKGDLVLNAQPSFIDTTFDFSPEMEDVCIIYRGYLPIKTNHWLETDHSGRKIAGFYNQGKKNSFWIWSPPEQAAIFWNYKNGELIDSSISKIKTNQQRPNRCISEHVPSEIEEFLLFFPSKAVKNQQITKALFTTKVIKSDYPPLPSDTLSIFSFDQAGFVFNKAQIVDLQDSNSTHYYIRDDKHRVIAYKNGFLNTNDTSLISSYAYPQKNIIIESRRNVERFESPDDAQNDLTSKITHRAIKKFDAKNRLIEQSYNNYAFSPFSKVDTNVRKFTYTYDEKEYLGIQSIYYNDELYYVDTSTYNEHWKISVSESINYNNNEINYGSYYQYNDNHQITQFRSTNVVHHDDLSYAHCPDQNNYTLDYQYDASGLLTSILYSFENTILEIQVTYLR